jgi:hypothetical protein
MSPLYRNLGLLRAIKDARRRCKKVDAAAYQEDYKNLAMWVARCTDSGEFAVFIGPNADVQVSPCKDAEKLKLPICRPLPPATEEKAAR